MRIPLGPERGSQDVTQASVFIGGKAWLIEMPTAADDRGLLTPFEFAALPFIPNRAFIVHDVPAGARRGGHAHQREKQRLVCLAGRIGVRLVAGKDDENIILDSPGRALFIDSGVWAEQQYLDPGSCLLVLASEPYDRRDYIDMPL
jgi:dTDP-4-dehydrorhamnose 3,5-epimerase-like enzyme